MKLNNIISLIIGILLITTGVFSYIADYNYKNRNYKEAITFNPFEPRYQMKYLLYTKEPTKEEVSTFYKKNRYNPYVSEYILLWYKSHLSEDNKGVYKELLTMAITDYPQSINIRKLYNEIF